MKKKRIKKKLNQGISFMKTLMMSDDLKISFMVR